MSPYIPRSIAIAPPLALTSQPIVAVHPLHDEARRPHVHGCAWPATWHIKGALSTASRPNLRLRSQRVESHLGRSADI